MPIFRNHDVAGRLHAARRITLLLLFGLAFTVTPTVATLAQIAPLERPVSTDPYTAHVAEASQRFGVPAAWIRAVMRAESAGDVRAISSAGAMGLMQIMPDTWADLRVRHRLGSDPYDPRDNILAGAAYLREMHDRYGSPGFLAAYNGGPGRYEEYLSGGRSLPAETRAYVAALAPLVGGGDVAGPVIVATAEPLSWTRSPLFVARAVAAPAADAVPPDGRPNGAANGPSVRDVSGIAPQSSGLFVARPNAGEP
ncbi:lytic transglycosylase [Afipia sp. P52-10]|jgi:hypothetical protein|uniref:lytic transglycosylase domain-containing protein n=1 Tax=Afipia sp. P52-10 TaxID=1429916 RepID=UPI0003DEFAD2|nr:lytic transglycosylase domain-containing protein [Afipia sp. P52-10]ETR77838.1 lytic transglycosylase [Afipia sp. P52-10]